VFVGIFILINDSFEIFHVRKYVFEFIGGVFGSDLIVFVVIIFS
jgi:hypothetical protein